MKTTLSIFGVLMIISSVVLAGGTVDPLTTSNMAILKTIDGVKVFYKSEKVAKVKVTIYDEANKKVFFEEVKSRAGFSRPYNLSSLPEGDYRIVMQDENGISEKTVSNIKENVEVLSSIINARNKYSRCMVTLFSKGESDVTVRLLDENKNELISENFTVKGQSSKLFNLENVKGAVSVEVSDKNGLLKSAIIE